MSGKQSKIVSTVRASRPSFLILSPICAFLGYSIAIHHQFDVNNILFALTLLGAVSAHVSVNLLNEYYDFKSGLDFNTIKTNFSGGSGTLPDNPETVNTVLLAGMVSLLLTAFIGIYFVWLYDWQILPIGLGGLILIVTYTKWINRNPFLCLIAPGTGFGFFIVAGTYFVLTGEYAASLWLICLIPFFLINNLLLLNQYPDIEADKIAGRKHILISFGTKAGIISYALFTASCMFALIVAVITGVLPNLALIALLPMPLAIFALYGVIQYRNKLGNYPKYLAANVAVTLLTPTLLGLSLLWLN